MRWSPQQESALVAVAAWLAEGHSRKPFFYLAGYAGTGKTTLARHFAEDLGGTVLYAAYTGKAAHVLRSKGCVGAQTIHSLIYLSAGDTSEQEARIWQGIRDLTIELEKEADQASAYAKELTKRIERLERELETERRRDRRPAFRLNLESELSHAALLVVDECSMVDQRVGEDLIQFGVPILVLGDPAQLPPVGGGGYFTGGKPDVLLTEVHRQAEGSPVLQLATMARNQRPLPLGRYGDSTVVSRSARADLQRFALEADQIIVGRNKTRHATNDHYRRLKGLTEPWPVEGDRLVCLRNDAMVGLLNGALWDVEWCTPHEEDLTVDLRLRPAPGEVGPKVTTVAWAHHFLGREDELRGWTARDHHEFDYGYALTCHKAQGSQWGSVYVRDESRTFGQDWWRWLYTAITRAAHNVTVVVD